MAWISKFSGLPTLTILPVAGDTYLAGVFTIGPGTPVADRNWHSGINLGSAQEGPIAYETLAGMGASIAQVLRVTARYASRSAGIQDMGAGVALFGPGTDDDVAVKNEEFDTSASPGDGFIDGHTWENDVLVGGFGPLPTTAEPPPHQYRIYWNGTGSAFIIPDPGFSSWSIAANTVSYWASKDDGTTWTRLTDRAIAAGVAPTRVGIFLSNNTILGPPGDTVTFSNLEVMQEGALPYAPQKAQIIIAAGRNNATNKAALYKYNAITRAWSLFHENPSATAISHTQSFFKDIHIRDGKNIAAVGNYSGHNPERAWISYLRDGVWYDWDFVAGSTQHQFDSVVIRPDGKLWITGITPNSGANQAGLAEFDPDTAGFTVLRTNIVNEWNGIQWFSDDLLVMDSRLASSSGRSPQLYNGSWSELGDPGDGHDGWNCFTYYGGKVYVGSAGIGAGITIRRRDGSWVNLTSATPQTNRYALSLHINSESDLYLLHCNNSNLDLILSKWNGASWSTVYSFGAGHGGYVGSQALRFASDGRAYVMQGVDADTQRLHFSDDLITWLSDDLPYRSGKGNFKLFEQDSEVDWLLGGRDAVGDSGGVEHSEIQKYSGGSFAQKRLGVLGTDSLITGFFRKADTVYAVGAHSRAHAEYDEDARVFLQSMDGGESWAGVEVLDTDFRIKSGLVRSDGEVWVAVAGFAPGVHRRNGVGDYTFLVSQISGVIGEILHVTDDDIWVSGASGDAWQWDGAVWAGRGKPSTDVCEFLLGDSSDILFIGNQTIAAHDTGTSWLAALWTDGTTDYKFMCGHYEATNDFWLGGLYQGFPTIWHWDGSSLNVVWQSTIGADLKYGVFALKRSPTNGFFVAVGRQAGTPDATLLESIDGLVWAEVALPSTFEALTALPLDLYVAPKLPTVRLIRPTHGASDVDQGLTIRVELRDAGDGLSEASVIITVDGAVAWTGEAQQAGFVVTKTTFGGGVQYEINPDTDFGPSAVAAVEVYVEDTAVPPNSLRAQREFHTGGWV